MTKSKKQFAVVAIPLNRPDVAEFLQQRATPPRGAPLQIIGQRPTEEAERHWLKQVEATETPTVADLLALDDPHGHLISTRTDRLVPVQFLKEPDFLTRNMGGWAAIYFGVAGLPAFGVDDPLLSRVELLTEYGDSIRYFGADPAQVERRWAEEMDLSVADTAWAWHHLQQVKGQTGQRGDYVERIYATLIGEDALDTDRPLPDLLLFDTLLGELVRFEAARRQAVAEGQQAKAGEIEAQQTAWREAYGLHLILKGEYIVGRHRRSTILIAPELGVVIKQPAPEPFHEIELKAKVVDGQAENWPRTTGDGALVTARGRLRLVAEEAVVPRLSKILGHPTRYSTLLGLTIEEFVQGQTLQEFVRADPSRMTADLYDEIILNQQVCELIGGENGDWHAANFMFRKRDGQMVHIDWGAARPLYPNEKTIEGRYARLNQVQNISFSFHDDELADQVMHLHAELMADRERLKHIREKARRLIEEAGATV